MANGSVAKNVDLQAALARISTLTIKINDNDDNVVLQAVRQLLPE